MKGKINNVRQINMLNDTDDYKLDINYLFRRRGGTNEERQEKYQIKDYRERE